MTTGQSATSPEFCCQPTRGVAAGCSEISVQCQATGRVPAHDDVLIAGGRFVMGDVLDEGYDTDGERPVHAVELDTFRMDRTCVTNSQFAAFATDTGYVTDAERFESSAVFASAVMAETTDIVGRFGVPWWLAVKGADWRHPFGPLSDLDGMGDHPVVHVSHADAVAYCNWAGRALPTEAQWECAARGGHSGRRFPWGDLLEQDGRHWANVWQGRFPSHNDAADGYRATAPVYTYPPNDFGLYQMVGNVWEWCADWFASDYYERAPLANPKGPDNGEARVVRGGSYLCHHSYCHRYRVTARSANTPDSSAGNLGFRTVCRQATDQIAPDSV